VTIFSNELAAKRLDLLRELVPHSKSIAVLINSDFGPSARFRADVEAAARALGLAAPILDASNPSEIETASITSLKPALMPFWSGPAHF
jgi:putative tryptophan/tyrosine transport system substrate-binding protein